MEASRRGEREAFGALIERYQGVVCAVSYSRTGDRALSEDVAQDTFLAAWSRLDQLREAGRLRAWLCGIARNLARKARLRTEREAPTEALSTTCGGANPFDQVAEVEAERVVRDALTRVPETYRDVLVLYYREQRSVREVAQLLGLSEAATLQRLSRGRHYLTAGVTELVERSLRGHVQKSLVAGVLAAIVFTPSHASAATHAKGTSMIKLVLVGAAFAAAGTTAVITHPWSHSSSSAAALTPSVAAAPVAVHAEREPALPAPRPAPYHVVEGAHVPVPANAVRQPGPYDLPRLDRAALDKAKVTQGPAKGAANAPVTITMYSDMICPYCGNSLGTLDQLMDEYPGKLRIVMKQLPVHTAAVMPAEANYAADAQGKFWELHDLMAQHQDDLSRGNVEALAQQAGLDMTAFRAALDNHTFKPAVAADIASAKDIELNATPSFVINGRRVIGNLPVESFRAVIDDVLAHP
ncbi:MAG TPA: sigma-70 family RNA polymerase sigma factor [Kofleriaceae bacterium]|nr:sigma-70 family RNA polymerase sigma factor [Kofleriaceae bacterium]